MLREENRMILDYVIENEKETVQMIHSPMDNYDIEIVMDYDDEQLKEFVNKVYDLNDMRLIFFSARNKGRNQDLLKHIKKKILIMEGGVC